MSGGYRNTQHIAYKSGEMTSIGKSAWDNGVGILVAGCGGSNGGGNYGWSDSGQSLWQVVNGGAGGGLNGGSAFYYDNDGSDFDEYFSGGSQNGGNSRAAWGSAGYNGAGAGYYSGYGGISSNGNGGSGGSGWIAGCPSITFKGKTYSPSTSTGGGGRSNGYARITFVEPSISIDEFILTPSTWTNSSVEVTLVTTDNVTQCRLENEEWQVSKKYTLTDNGTYTFTVIDSDGNTATEILKIDFIDKASPSINTLITLKKPSRQTTITIQTDDN